MLWFDKHARLRHTLSPYIDHQLTASETVALEAHLTSCDACRRRLDELRATLSALHEQPQAEAPRSFAITPGMLERKSAAAARPLPALGLGMRLAGAGVAVALAVVVVGDLTLGDNGGASPQAGSQPAEESRVTEMFSDADTSKSSESGAYPPPSGNAGSSTTPFNAAAAAPCAPATVPSTTGSGAGGAGAAGGAGGTSAGPGSSETPVASATPQPAPTPSTGLNIATICSGSAGGAAAPVAPQTPENAAPRAAPADNGGGGISTLRIAEIALAAVLIVILAATVLEAAMRRRRIA